MRQTLQSSDWRSEAGSRLWLSALIAAMEDASRPDRRPVSHATLDALRVQLALPASFGAYQASSQRH
jgi:hypothetical protein